MRPYIICHMVASVDGRIDCSMVVHLSPLSSTESPTVPAFSRPSGSQICRDSRRWSPLDKIFCRSRLIFLIGLLPEITIFADLSNPQRQ